MASIKSDSKNSGRVLKNLTILIVVLIIFIGIPYLFLNYQARKSGMSIGTAFQRKVNKSNTADSPAEEKKAMTLAGEKIDFLTYQPIGRTFDEPPQISNICTSDLDDDGLPDIIVCDAKNNSVSWIRQKPSGIYIEKDLEPDLMAPAHVQVIDFDKDGDKDIIVALLGIIFPSNDKIGSVVILENDGKCNFTKHVVAEKIARVSDARAGDLDGDGDLDLAAGQFGYDDGETRWIENLGNWTFKSHILQNLSGPVNVEIVDIENDGRSGFDFSC